MTQQVRHIISANRIDTIKYIVVDLFCGFGGTSHGYNKANYAGLKSYLERIGVKVPAMLSQFTKLCLIAAAVNHDPMAIKSHWANMPEVEHFEEDMRLLNPFGRLKRLIELYRAFYPEAKIILFASLECVNFSISKGGQTKDADSRTLAEHLYGYIDAIEPDYVKIENVLEFRKWGPLIPKVVKDENGYKSCPLVYKKLKTLNKRNFGIADSRIDVSYDLSKDLGKYVEQILNPDLVYFEETKISLSGRKKTSGYKIEPFFIPDPDHEGESFEAWINEINSRGYRDEWRVMNSADLGAYTSRKRLFGCFAKQGLPIIWPIPTHSKNGNGDNGLEKWKAVKEVLDFENEGRSVFNRKKDLSTKTNERLFKGCVKHVAGEGKEFIERYFSDEIIDSFSRAVRENGNGSPLILSPIMDDRQLSAAEADSFLSKAYSGDPENKNISIEGPAGAVTCKDHHQVVNIKFRIEKEAITIGRDGNPAAHFIQKYYSTGGVLSSINEPSHALSTKDRMSKATLKFNSATSIDQPRKVLLSRKKVNRIELIKKHHYLINPSWGVNTGSSVENPSPVIIARQDKAPLYLISCSTGEFRIPIYKSDCRWTIRLKLFMAMFNIVDIKLRMLIVPELIKIQGFPEDYKICGTATDAKKFIGNSVVPLVSEHWIYSYIAGDEMLQMAA